MKSNYSKSIFVLVIFTLLAAACSSGGLNQPANTQTNTNQTTQVAENQNNANEQQNENSILNANSNENSNENTNENTNQNANDNANANSNANDNASQGTEIEIEGIVESVQPGSVVVNGEEINIEDFPEASPLLLPGVTVKIKAVVQADGSLLAVRVEIGDLRWESGAGLLNSNSNSNANSNTTPANTNNNSNEVENDNNSNGG
jgi:hypothetical protein